MLQVRIEPGPSNMPDERSTTAPCHSAWSIILKNTIEDIQPCFNTFCYRSKLGNFPYSYKPWTPYKKVSVTYLQGACPNVQVLSFKPNSSFQLASMAEQGVCVWPGLKPRRQIFSCRGSYETTLKQYTCTTFVIHFFISTNNTCISAHCTTVIHVYKSCCFVVVVFCLIWCFTSQ